jgi:1,4-alpha-glucan branching enzyme
MKKTYSKKKTSAKVTFRVPAEVGAESAAVVGDFNEWSETEHPMKRRKDGSFSTTLTLKSGEYRFRYLVNGTTWENDWDADKYVANEFGSEDSVVTV